jgi:hypothetical protein
MTLAYTFYNGHTGHNNNNTLDNHLERVSIANVPCRRYWRLDAEVWLVSEQPQAEESNYQNSLMASDPNL